VSVRAVRRTKHQYVDLSTEYIYFLSVQVICQRHRDGVLVAPERKGTATIETQTLQTIGNLSTMPLSHRPRAIYTQSVHECLQVPMHRANFILHPWDIDRDIVVLPSVVTHNPTP